VAPEATLQSHVRTAPFQALPLELTLLQHLPGYYLRGWGDGVWVVPKENFSGEERHPNGVWVRGASRSQVVVVTAAPIAKIHLRAYSLSPDNVLTIASPVDRVSVRFDTQEKREGTPLDFAVSPAARDLGFFSDHPAVRHEWFYRFTVTTTDGIVPARRDAKSQDLRYLGAFLSFNDRAP